MLGKEFSALDFYMARDNPFEITPTSRFGRSRVVRSFRSFELDDTTLAAGDVNSTSLKNQINIQRLIWLTIICFILVGTLFFRGVWLQIVQGSTLRNSAENNRIRIVTNTAARGIIFDRNGLPLVENVAEFSFSIVPADLPREKSAREAEIKSLVDIVKTPLAEAIDKLAKTTSNSIEPVPILEHITYDQAMRLRIAAKEHIAAQVNPTPKRHYIAGNAFSNLLGYTGKLSAEEWKTLSERNDNEYQMNDIIGKSGLELTYETQLRGTSEKSSVEVDSARREQKTLASRAAVPGQNISTTIDKGLQQVLAEATEKALRGLHDSGAAVVAIDPRDGGVLAMVNEPTYDNNLFVGGMNTEQYEKLAKDPSKPLFFRAIAGEYPSGSTIKPVIATAALDQGIITEQTQINSTGGIRIDKWFFPDWKSGGHGMTNVTKAIAQSVNTFFYTIGGGTDTFKGLGIDLMTQYARTFGLGSPMGIDLPGERPGFLPTKAWKEQTKGEPWYIGDTYHFAIGQGDLLVTPLQMASVTATVANGGVVYKPHIAKAFQSSDQKDLHTIEPVVVRDQVAKPGIVDIVRKGMRQAVIDGSAKALQSIGVPAGGKTGTAQFGSSGKTHAWFIGFVPYDNPTIAIAVIVEGGGEGHAEALPIAAAGMKYWLEHQAK
jgi:penicillin-binding protein 2